MSDEEKGRRRVLLKLSGEALGPQTHALRPGDLPIYDPENVERFCEEISLAVKQGVEATVVVGGGNIFRGVQGSKMKLGREAADKMGMLATVMNGLALQETLENMGHKTRLMSAIPMPKICEEHIDRRADRHLEKARIVVCVAGTGRPRFTTDTSAILLGAELKVDLVLKATDVKGIYTKDPNKYPEDAKMYRHLPYRLAIDMQLKVMDLTAMTMAEDEKDLKIRVFSLIKSGNITKALMGDPLGTLVTKSTDIVMADQAEVDAE